MKNENNESHYELDNGQLTDEQHEIICNRCGLEVTEDDLKNSLLEEPWYEADDSDITDEQIEYLRSISPATNIPDSAFTRLY